MALETGISELRTRTPGHNLHPSGLLSPRLSKEPGGLRHECAGDSMSSKGWPSAPSGLPGCLALPGLRMKSLSGQGPPVHWIRQKGTGYVPWEAVPSHPPPPPVGKNPTGPLLSWHLTRATSLAASCTATVFWTFQQITFNESDTLTVT